MSVDLEPYSLIVRNALIVDGRGTPGAHGDIGIKGDRIAAIGVVSEQAAHEIDAKGLVLAPGFIDVHTHYDPQLCWDRFATPSPEHGVTSLVMGNCSISLAPVRPADTAKVIHLFGSVEDMEGRLLEATVPFEWETMTEYLDYLRQGLGPNVGVFVGHSVLRYYVMGAAAQQRAATPEEIAQMTAELGTAIVAGAIGLSFSFSHLDEVGQQLPCFYAEREEILALMQEMARQGRGLVEVSPQPLGGGDTLDKIDLFGGLSLETGVTVSLSPILHLPMAPDRWRELVARIEGWREKGAPLFAQTQTRPLDMTIRLDQGSPLLSKGETWRKTMDRRPGDRLKIFRDAALRDAFFQEASANSKVFDSIVVREVVSDANRQYVGRSLKDISASTGKRFTDVLIDISLDDDLKTEFSLENFIHAEAHDVTQLLRHPALHVGSGDAGAHITAFAGAGDTCYLFERYVRKEGSFTVEQAVQRLTSDIARDWKIAERGAIEVGYFADLVLFDPDRIARGEEVWVNDVPGGHGRYVRHPEGIKTVIVNGKVLVDDGVYSAEMPGRLI